MGCLFQEFRNLVMGEPVDSGAKTLGKLVVFGGVSQYPVRVKCATLAWHTLQAALNNNKNGTTET